jgi:hypothetical protein
MQPVSLKGQVHVNLADFSSNGCIYPWIGEGCETPDLRGSDREIFQFVSDKSVS